MEGWVNILMGDWETRLRAEALQRAGTEMRRKGRYLEPQVEQLVAAHPLQEELAVLLNFPPLEKAKADIVR